MGRGFGRISLDLQMDIRQYKRGDICDLIEKPMGFFVKAKYAEFPRNAKFFKT
jgi:hypothetical protein